jgi:hypothetical protein
VIQESLKLTISQFLKFLETGSSPSRGARHLRSGAREEPIPSADPIEANEKTLEEFLDRIAHHRHGISFTFDTKDYPDSPEIPDGHFRKLVSKRFPNYGYYNCADIVTEAINESPVVVGDAILDLEEIAGELHEVLWRWENNSADDALWYFDFSYNSHWGRHLRDLQLYVWNLKQGI